MRILAATGSPMLTSTPRRAASLDPKVLTICMVAWVASYIVSFTTPPLANFPSQWLATLTWGIVLSGTLAASFNALRQPAVRLLLGAGMVMVLCAAWQHHLVSAGLLAAALAALIFGASVDEPRWTYSLLTALVVAGVISVGLATQQTFAPELSRLAWLPPLGGSPGRAVASLGQPNMLAALLLWALVALMGLLSTQHLRSKPLAASIAFALGAGLAFTGSRTGLLGFALVCVWAWRDTALQTSTRRLPAFTGAGMATGLTLNWLAAQAGQAVFFATVRAHGHSDVSSSRFSVWRDSFSLLCEHPLTGVGWGNFNFAWTLSELPQRHSALFDNAHNLPLQLAVELGIPAAAIISGALVWCLVNAARMAFTPSAPHAVLRRCAVVMLALIGLHSLLEYPLWYAYMLLPSAYLLGMCLRPSRAPAESKEPARASDATTSTATRVLQGFGVAIVCACLYSAWDYSRVLQIYAPFGPSRRVPETERIERGQKSLLFGAYADYAAVVTAKDPSAVFSAFNRPMHNLIDSHMLVAYAQALNTRGEILKARYVAQRVRELNHPSAAQFFAVCAPVDVAKLQSFQCATEPVHLSFDAFQ